MPAEVNSACTTVLARPNTCTAQKRRGPEGRFSEMLYLFRMHMKAGSLPRKACFLYRLGAAYGQSGFVRVLAL